MYNELFFSVASKWREISLPVKICTKCKSTHGSYCDSDAVQEACVHAEGSRTTPENPIVAGEFVSQEKKAIIFIFYKDSICFTQMLSYLSGLNVILGIKNEKILITFFY